MERILIGEPLKIHALDETRPRAAIRSRRRVDTAAIGQLESHESSLSPFEASNPREKMSDQSENSEEPMTIGVQREPEGPRLRSQDRAEAQPQLIEIGHVGPTNSTPLPAEQPEVAAPPKRAPARKRAPRKATGTSLLKTTKSVSELKLQRELNKSKQELSQLQEQFVPKEEFDQLRRNMAELMNQMIKLTHGSQATHADQRAPTNQHQHQYQQKRDSSSDTEVEPELPRKSSEEPAYAIKQQQQHVVQHVEIPKPPNFDGDDDKALSWLLEFKLAADTNRWDDATRILHLGTALISSAKAWYLATWTTNRPRSWQEFEEEFAINYMQGSLVHHVNYKLNNLRQKQNETLKQYFHHALQLVSLVPTHFDELSKVQFILEGMDSEARRRIKIMSPKTLIELRDRVLAYCATYGTKTTPPKQKQESRDPTNSPKNEKAERKGVPKEENFCLNCGQKGHYVRGCPQPHNEEMIKRRKEEWKQNPPFKRSSPNQGMGSQRARAIKNEAIDTNLALYAPENEPQTSAINQQESYAPIVQSTRRIALKDAPDESVPRPYIGSVRLSTAQQSGKCLQFKCRINGQLEEATLDTGASITVLTTDLVQSTNTEVYKWKWDKVGLADGSKQIPFGWCRATIEFQNRCFTVSAVVLEKAPEILIGHDYLEKAQMIISYADKIATYQDVYAGLVGELKQRAKYKTASITTQTEGHKQEVEIDQIKRVDAPDHATDQFYIEHFENNDQNLIIGRMAQQNTRPRIEIRSKKRVTIPPRSRARVEASALCDNSNGRPFIIESSVRADAHVLPGIAKRRSTVVDIINVQAKSIQIQRREAIAHAVLLDEQVQDDTNTVPLPEGLQLEQRQAALNLIKKHQSLFVTTNEAIGVVPFIKHAIDTGDSPPIRTKPYRVSIMEQKVIKKLIDEMLDADIIRPSKSHWASPVVLVKKKGTTDLRFCIDYRKLNKITRVDPYPIPNMDTVLETLSGNHWFSKLDVKAMYWQVLMEDASKQKTAFVVHCGQYEFNVMPFGLVSAPMTAMRVMNQITSGMETTTFVFYDDILTFTADFEQHVAALDELFTRLKAANIKLNAKKCDIFLNSVKYLGYVVNPNGILPDPDKTRAINAFKTPTNITEARSFIGMCNFFRRFIKGFAAIARPINDTIKVKQEFVWTPEAEAAMKALKEKLTSPPILVHFDVNSDIFVRCDASGYGLGAVLMQKSNDSTHSGVVAYASRTLIPSERNYATTHKECLAMVHAVKHWRHYLYGKQFTVVTDHHALCWLMKTKDHTGQLMRWSLILQEFSFEIQYESGKVHADADCLSRNPIDAQEDEVETEIPTWPIHAVSKSQSTAQLATIKNDELILPTYDVAQEQARDAFCGPIMTKIQDKTLSKRKLRKYKSYAIKDGQLYRRSKHDKHRFVLVLPLTMVNFVLNETHDKPTGGHFGVRRTLDAIKKRFFWQTMNDDVKRYIKSCNLCQRKKGNTKRKEGFMIPMPIPSQPFDIIGADLMGPLPKSNTYQHVLVITDYLTKYVITQPLRNATTGILIEAFKRHVFYRHGLPRTIITDNGSNFCSHEMRSILELMKIKHKTTSPYRPQTNGQTERYNRVLGNQFAIFADGHPKTWSKYIDALTFAYNTTIHASHLTTPYYLVHAREPRTALDIAINDATQLALDQDNLDETTEVDLVREARKLARELITKSQLRAKATYDRHRVKPSHKIGDLVLKRNPIRRGDTKFTLPWQGPFKIVKIISDLNYQIVDLATNEDSIVHISQIRPYHTRPSATNEERDTSGGSG